MKVNPIKQKPNKVANNVILQIIGLYFIINTFGCTELRLNKPDLSYTTIPVEHKVVYKQPGKFCGWPANHGIWNWGDEIVVGFEIGYYKPEISAILVTWKTMMSILTE